MKLGLQTTRLTLNFGLWGRGLAPNLEMVRFAENLGYDSVWTSEMTGTDGVVPLAMLAAHTKRIKLGTGVLQMSARVPTMTASTSATMDLLSDGRFILGIGVSGPALVEGWQGTRFERPIEQTREYIQIVRGAMARNGRLRHSGERYSLPLVEEGRRVDGVPMRLTVRPRRRQVPIYLGAIGPKNVSLGFEIADGIIPEFYSPYRESAFFDGVESHGRAGAVDIAPFVPIAVGDNVQVCRDRVKPRVALFIGGMGDHRNFYNTLAIRLGCEDFARSVQESFRAGRMTEAASCVPDDFVDEVALCGPPERIAERLEAWKKSRASTLILLGADRKSIVTMAELVL